MLTGYPGVAEDASMKELIRPFLSAAAVAAVLVAAAAPLRAQSPANPLPPGDGRDIVAVACSQCHGLNVLAQLREGAPAWRFQVYDMILRGAQVTPKDIDPVVNYLAASFGPGVPFPGPPPAAVTLPDGAGKDLVEGACGLCHGLDRVATTRRGPHAWDAIVARMVFFGAPLDVGQTKTVTTYLDTAFGSK